MGKISSEPRHAETRTTHFSHPHPLTLISHHPIPNPNPNLAHYSSCSGCKLKPSAGAMIYSCTTCNFFLHKECFEMPQKITHPFHKEHALDLLPAPAYAEGAYSCDACREAGTGFSYHFKPCGVDLHILCAAAPLSLTSACHAHELELQFESPYVEKSFSCDVCRGHGSNHWLYRCNLCGFDAHLRCARAARPVVNPVSHANFMGFQPVAAAPAPVSVVAPYPMMNNAAVGVPAVSRKSGQLSQFQTIMQSIHNNHAAMASRIGGGGGGAGLQQLTRFISGLNNTTGFGGGGGGDGGGGSIPGLNAFSGGGGGQDFLQALMNGGGGGGGLDSLQFLPGGGGGGGLDSLQSLLGDSGGLDFLGGVGDLL